MFMKCSKTQPRRSNTTRSVNSHCAPLRSMIDGHNAPIHFNQHQTGGVQRQAGSINERPDDDPILTAIQLRHVRRCARQSAAAAAAAVTALIE
jgi:hypothetical protein